MIANISISKKDVVYKFSMYSSNNYFKNFNSILHISVNIIGHQKANCQGKDSKIKHWLNKELVS